MKKVILFVYVLFSLVSVFGCEKSYEDSADILFTQYESYLEEDIASPELFNAFLNEASNQTIPGIVTVRKIIKNSFGLTLETKEGTGFIYEIYDNSIRVLTANELVVLESEEYTVTYEIYDFANRTYSALVLDRSEEYGLARLKFDTITSISRLRKLTISEYIPMYNEPLLMISNYRRTHNSMLMGILLSKNEETDYYTTSLPVDEFSVGGIVVDMRNEIVGIMIGYAENQSTILGLKTIREYLEI